MLFSVCVCVCMCVCVCVCSTLCLSLEYTLVKKKKRLIDMKQHGACQWHTNNLMSVYLHDTGHGLAATNTQPSWNQWLQCQKNMSARWPRTASSAGWTAGGRPCSLHLSSSVVRTSHTSTSPAGSCVKYRPLQPPDIKLTRNNNTRRATNHPPFIRSRRDSLFSSCLLYALVVTQSKSSEMRSGVIFRRGGLE